MTCRSEECLSRAPQVVKQMKALLDALRPKKETTENSETSYQEMPPQNETESGGTIAGPGVFGSAIKQQHAS